MLPTLLDAAGATYPTLRRGAARACRRSDPCDWHSPAGSCCSTLRPSSIFKDAVRDAAINEVEIEPSSSLARIVLDEVRLVDRANARRRDPP